MNDKGLCDLHNQYHDCRWLGDVRIQGINSFGIVLLVFIKYSTFSPERVNACSFKVIARDVLFYMTATSKLVRWRLQSPASPLFTQTFIQALIIEHTKAPRHWPLCGEFTVERWIPCTNGQQRGKCFHLMSSSWIILLLSYCARMS